jgi:CheY-like chemotaxis protein
MLQEPRQHILVVDDEPAVRDVFRAALERGGFAVSTAATGREALEAIRNAPVDVVMTDLWMPEMNGVELIEAARARGCTAAIMVLSSHLTPTTTDKLRALGVERILSKPVAPKSLLDAVAAALSQDASRPRSPVPAAREGESGEQPRPVVLVADDDPVVRDLVRASLASKGYVIEEACNGLEAVEKVLAHDIDLVVTDLHMPDMGGVEAIETLKRATRDTFIVSMTGEAGQNEIAAALRAGAVECLRKPFDTRALVDVVGRLDLIAAHRKRLRDREKLLLNQQPLRRRRKRALLLAAAALVIVAAAVAVPVLMAAARKADDAAARIRNATDSVNRIEGYLERDEQRELRGHGR